MAERSDAFMGAVKRVLFRPPDPPPETDAERWGRLRADFPRATDLLADVIPGGRINRAAGVANKDEVWLTAFERILARLEALEQREGNP